jgi:thiol peroxidase
MARTVTFKGNPLTLAGRYLNQGESAPDFRVTAQDLSEVRLANFQDKIKVLTSFPSLDTPVCDLQVKEFNSRATGFSKDVVVVGISKDLPFAQKRFCETFEIKNAVVVSDYKTASFGINYGLLIRELNLLARAVVIIDKNDLIRYIQVVPEVTRSLDYDDVLKGLEAVVKQPQAAGKEGVAQKCLPCEGKVASLPKERVGKLILGHRLGQVVEDKKIVKELKFKDAQEAKYFLDLICLIAEEQGHHPTLTLSYNKLKITLSTHAAGGLTDNDFIMAGIIDGLGE